jgi:hypothetical protein
MTEADFELLKKRIEKSGLNQAEFLRKAALNKQILSTDGIKAVVPELKRIGNNLNQIARRCNEGYPAAYGEIASQAREMSEVWQLLRRLLQERASVQS